MYRVYYLTEKESGKRIISHFDGDCTTYSVFESEAEYKQETERLKRIEEDYKRQMEAYYKTV